MADPSESSPCSPVIRKSPNYPHNIAMMCWDHGEIADLGSFTTLVEVERIAAKHRNDVRATSTTEEADRAAS